MRHRSPVLLAVAAATSLAGLLAQPACARQDAAGQDAFAAYRSGQYDGAIRSLRGLAAAPDADARTHRTLVAALLEVGRYEDAERAAREAAARPALAGELANMLGEALLATGKRAAAEQAFRQSVDARASDANTARLNLAELDWDRGERAAALDAFDAFIDIYNQSSQLRSRDLIAVGDAVARLGVRDDQLFHDAVKAYEEALKADNGTIDGRPADVEATLRLGNIFLEKYESTEAQSLFREVLAINENHPRALLGMAMAKNFDGSNESMEFITQSLEVNANSIPARVFHARLLMELEQYEEAEAEIEKALAIDATSLDALAAKAAAAFLQADEAEFAAIERQVLAIDPMHAELYNDVAELAVRQRQYERAVTLASQAIALDSTSWMGYGILGVNQLRTGAVDSARTSLETSFEGDPYNPWIKNTLDLLDTFGEYETVTTDRFEFMLHGNEAALLEPYITALADEAFDSLSARYRWQPDERIRIEVYPRHADFSVRTVGLSGLGALGVAFGNVLSMDSPSARERGAFNWGTTLWHELAHTFTLGVTDHRIPRWLTEGLSVAEERRARPGWGDDALVDFLAAYEHGEMPPVRRLNEGFVRPRFPAQVGLAYFEASLVVEYIERKHGFQAIRDMLQGYREGKGEAEIFADVLDAEPERFDGEFDAWVRETYAGQLDAIDVPDREARAAGRSGRGDVSARAVEAPPGDFFAQLRRGHALLEEGKDAEATPYFERAKALVPEYVTDGNPYRALAEIHQKAGRNREAANELIALTQRNENDYEANLRLASLLEDLGDTAGSAAALERAVWISPYDATLHQKLAEMYSATGNRQGVVRARAAIVALKPVDLAEALYQLALAQLEAGDRDAARRTVLRTLEIAPNFERAQELLLRVRSGGAT
ncbi:MAG: tetratricopeptide repeat protein [Longimicrobiales bacterium]